MDCQLGCIVYILGSHDKDRHGNCRALTYVGWTLDLERRLVQHNSGKGAKSTRGRVWRVLHVERYATRNEAMSREWHLKRDRAFRRQLAQAAALMSAAPSVGETVPQSDTAGTEP